jgi:fatty acid-binding protein DegV
MKPPDDLLSQPNPAASYTETLDRLAVLHTNAEACARQLLEEWRARVPVPPLLVNVTTVVGTHVGPDAVGFVGVSST